MKTILMMYLIILKGYSVMLIDGVWCSCDSSMEYNYGHSGSWGEGSTPQDAAYNCFKKL